MTTLTQEAVVERPAHVVRAAAPLAPIDRKTLLLMAIYKVARHEWVGITGAWDAAPPFSAAHHVITKIGR